MKTNLIDFLLDELYVHRIGAFFALCDFERHIVFLADLVNQTRHMNENILTATNRSDEAETFGLIEEFYYAFLHCGIKIKIK